MENNIFAKIREISAGILEKNRNRILKNRQAAQERLSGKRESLNEIKGYAAECQEFFNEKRYQNTQRFIDGCEKGMIDNLINLSISIKNKEELVLEMVRVGAQIELLRTIKNKPQRIVEQIESLKNRTGV